MLAELNKQILGREIIKQIFAKIKKIDIFQLIIYVFLGLGTGLFIGYMLRGYI